MGSYISINNNKYLTTINELSIESILNLDDLYQEIITIYNNIQYNINQDVNNKKQDLQQIYNIIKYIEDREQYYIKNHKYNYYMNNCINMVNNILYNIDISISY